MSFEDRALVAVLAFFLDLILKDPNYSLHPVRLIGKTLTFFEGPFYRINGGYLGGFLCYIFTVAFWLVLSFVFRSFLPLELFFVYSFVAAGQLWKEVEEIERLLKVGRMGDAKRRLSFLVTRDVEHLSKKGVALTALESLAENTSDGILGPLFWYVVGGLPLLFMYKVTETGDSMVGYKNERYRRFGFFFAKMDDLLNLVPARLTAIFVAFGCYMLSGRVKDVLRCCLKGASLHESPNAGYPEAAFSGCLGVFFGGWHRYFGRWVFKVPVGVYFDEVPEDVLERGILLSKLSTLLFLITILCLAYL